MEIGCLSKLGQREKIQLYNGNSNAATAKKVIEKLEEKLDSLKIYSV